MENNEELLKIWYKDQLEVFHSISDKMLELVTRTLAFYPKFEQPDEDLRTTLSSYCDANVEYLKCIEKNKAFYDRSLYDELVGIKEQCDDLGKLFALYERMIPDDKLQYAYADSHIAIKKARDKITESIRQSLYATYKSII